MSAWNAIWAPKGTPKDVIAKLNAPVTDALADPTARQRLADLGQQVVLHRLPVKCDRKPVQDSKMR
jgi:tripartite-type tricarboxylate transporter receptor subunit TctC